MPARKAPEGERSTVNNSVVSIIQHATYYTYRTKEDIAAFVFS